MSETAPVESELEPLALKAAVAAVVAEYSRPTFDKTYAERDAEAAIRAYLAARRSPSAELVETGEATEAQVEVLWQAVVLYLAPAISYVTVRERLRAALRTLSPQSLPPVTGGVAAVKALEWYQHDRTDVERHSGEGAFVAYFVTRVPPATEYSLNMSYWGSAGSPPFPLFGTADEAKAAAQADYEARIRSALESRPTGVGAAEAIQLTPAEIQSGLDRVRWAEGLIRQLPNTHDGRNSWLLNYGKGPHDWPTWGHCLRRKEPGGCQLHNLQCGYPDCDRRPAAPLPGEPL